MYAAASSRRRAFDESTAPMNAEASALPPPDDDASEQEIPLRSSLRNDILQNGNSTRNDKHSLIDSASGGAGPFFQIEHLVEDMLEHRKERAPERGSEHRPASPMLNHILGPCAVDHKS